MNESTTMIKQKMALLLFAASISFSSFAQLTQSFLDPEKKFKEAKEFFVQEQYALAYPLFAELKVENTDQSTSDQTYLADDVNYYYIVCKLKLQQPIAEDEARHYINVISNEPRRQLLSYHLAKYYFIKEDFTNAINYYERAGLYNLGNDDIAEAKFERAYCYFNLKQFAEAKPLFDEIHQMPDNKYFIPANYYFGFISYYNRDFNAALMAFKLVESQEAYKGVVPYYMAEIYYFQGKKDEALRYGESVLGRAGQLYYQKEMNLLIGQLYFEKKNYQKALPLLQSFVSESDKVSKEIMYELSYCYYDAGKLEKAIEGFKQLSNEKDSMGQNSMYLLGDCYLRTNQKTNARTAFQYSAFNNSNQLQQQISRFNYAKLSYELGYQDMALDEMKKYLHDYPNSDDDAEAREILVSLMANTNNFADALQLYETFEKPTAAMQKLYPRILYGRAVELINDQQIHKADELLSKVLSLPNSAVTAYANFWKGEIAYRNNEYDNAIKYLSVYLLTNVPAQGEANKNTANYNIGYCWLQKENYTKALGYFEQITKSVSVTSPAMEQDAYVRSADCYFMNSDFVKANNMYELVINNAMPQSDYAMLQKALIAGVKNSNLKISILNSLLKQYPGSNLVPDVNMEIAQTYIADEKFLTAVPYLNQVLNNPAAGGIKPRALLKLGLVYYNTDKYDDALTNYQLLVQKYPQSAEADEATDIMKNIYIETGKPNDYIEMMRRNGKSISINEADSLTYTAAGLKYNANDCKAAISGFKNYLTQFPNGTYVLEAHYFSSECYKAAKDFQNALLGYDYVNSLGLNRFFEKATLEAARISYFEIMDYGKAKKYFESLASGSVNEDNQLEALRGLVRCCYQVKDYEEANDAAKKLLTKKGISTDDRSIAFFVLGKSQQVNKDCTAAIASFKSCAAINKAAWGAEARYEMANCQFGMGSLALAEKSALAVIKETGSYDNWVTKSYILLGDIFMQQKDYFNAKATYESVAKNATITELKNEAQQKLDKAIEEEKSASKIAGNL